MNLACFLDLTELSVPSPHPPSPRLRRTGGGRGPSVSVYAKTKRLYTGGHAHFFYIGTLVSAISDKAVSRNNVINGQNKWFQCGLPLLVLASLLFLTACGFQPLYGSSATVSQRTESVTLNLNATEVATIPDRSGQLLRNALVQKMHTGAAEEKYRLAVSLRSDLTPMGIQKDATATLNRLNMTADFTLAEAATGKALYQSSSKSTVVYNILAAQYGSIVNERDAKERAINDIATEITTKLAAYFSKSSPAS